MAKITYIDKVKVRLQGPAVNTWRDDDANEVKQVVNENDSVLTGEGSTVKMDRIQGYRHGTDANPVTGSILINTANAVDGATAAVIWSGSSDPTITGGNVRYVDGSITSSGIYTIYFNYIAGGTNVNIFGQGGTPTPDLDPPAKMTITHVGDSVDGDTAPPAKMTITKIED